MKRKRTDDEELAMNDVSEPKKRKRRRKKSKNDSLSNHTKDTLTLKIDSQSLDPPKSTLSTSPKQKLSPKSLEKKEKKRAKKLRQKQKKAAEMAKVNHLDKDRLAAYGL